MTANPISMSEFFGYQRHPFADTQNLPKPFLSEEDIRIMAHSLSLIRLGKSLAIVGPSGSGKSTLAQHILANLDPHLYKATRLHYSGLQRSGILRALCDELGVETKGYAIPLLTKLQKAIFDSAKQGKPLYPVLVIDDAQLMPSEAFLDLCSLMTHSNQHGSAASLLFIGDEGLIRRFKLSVMMPVRSRLTHCFSQKLLGEEESKAFIAHRLALAKTKEPLIEEGALTLMCARCSGNRRAMMNMGTLLFEEAYLKKQRTISAELIVESGLFNESE